jgi:Carboxypeptidase regulatory-like domain
MRVALALAWSGLVLPGLVLAGCGGEPAPVTAAAEEGLRGVLAGVVFDAALRPLVAANVTATPAGGTSLTQSTDGNGSFRFTGLAAGTYALEASMPRHLSAHAVAQVGDQPGPLVQLLLEVQRDELPFVVQVAWEGYIGCAFTYGNLCSAPAQAGYDAIGDQSAHLFYDEYVSVGRVPTLIQGEAVWQATVPTSEELKPIYGWSEPVTWQQLGYLGTFFANSQRSPTFDRVPYDLSLNASIGIDNGLVVEFYSGGQMTQPTGLTVNQPVKLFLHNFYGYLPPDEWRFAIDGDPPPPPA